MRIATAPINWNNEDVPGYRPNTPYPKILDEIVRAGYATTEWSASLPEDPAELGPDLQRRGLGLLGAFVAMNLRDEATRASEVRRAVARAAFLKELGARYLVASDDGDAARLGAAGHAEHAPTMSDDQLAGMARALEELARTVRAMGVTLVFHPHVGTYVETPGEIDRLFAGTDPELVGWCLDTGHQVYGGADLRALVRAHGARVRYVHLKDVDRSVLAESRRRGWSFQDALQRFVFCPLGSGMVPLAEILEVLAGDGYEGWLVIEQDTTADDPTENAMRNRQWLERLLGNL
ncbi:MAG TPA: TIM barrel protein [Trueperaceae bacterium]|nr:TIM barrel protein [Trueperaceae bacterium]